MEKDVDTQSTYYNTPRGKLQAAAACYNEFKGMSFMIEVAAAILRDPQGRILICRRGKGGNCAGLWEFPGGKRERGETMKECLVRECREELEIDIAIDELYSEFTWAYPDVEIHFYFFNARIRNGHLKMDVHTAMKWVFSDELADYRFCPADADLVAGLVKDGKR